MVEVADGAAILVIAGYFLLAYRRTFRARTGFVLTALSLTVTAVLSSAGLGDAAAFTGVVTFALLASSVLHAAWEYYSRPAGDSS